MFFQSWGHLIFGHKHAKPCLCCTAVVVFIGHSSKVKLCFPLCVYHCFLCWLVHVRIVI